MKLITPPEFQGQIVDVAYGWHNGLLYRRVLDRSDRSVAWFVADEYDAACVPDEWHPVNGDVPVAVRWERTEDPEP